MDSLMDGAWWNCLANVNGFKMFNKLLIKGGEKTELKKVCKNVVGWFFSPASWKLSILNWLTKTFFFFLFFSSAFRMFMETTLIGMPKYWQCSLSLPQGPWYCLWRYHFYETCKWITPICFLKQSFMGVPSQSPAGRRNNVHELNIHNGFWEEYALNSFSYL